tara:strand:- start:1229 stop:1639 length:411 start_codon:yes stop_codon:yes gene_type:complete
MNLRELIIEREIQCKDGEYYCRTSGMCKPIPDGYSVMPDGELVKEVARVWSRTGGKQTRKYRCTHGHRKGRVMSSPAACNAPINVKKSVGLSSLKKKRGGTMANQAKITRRTNPASMRLPRLNKPKKTPFGRKTFK